MAEILLSLTIIGVVAAITLPSLTGNINERTWNTQRKALYARMSQALALMPSLNGYGKVVAETETASAVDNAAETFVTDGLSKVLKINNICDNDHLADCGIPNSINNFANSAINLDDIKTLRGLNSLFISNVGIPLDIKAAAFETQNSESILVYYNPNCKSDPGVLTVHFPQPHMCANFIYDLNGKKGPNTFGKDIGFITALYPTDPMIVAPMPLITLAGTGKHAEASEKCTAKDADSRLPNRDELAAMFYNRKFIDLSSSVYWSSSLISSGENGKAWALHWGESPYNPSSRTDTLAIRCIKR